jgi:hypothetical protein
VRSRDAHAQGGPRSPAFGTRDAAGQASDLRALAQEATKGSDMSIGEIAGIILIFFVIGWLFG